MFSKNPNRGSAVSKAKINISTTLVQPNPQQLYDLLQKANQRIAELEGRLQLIEQCLYVGAGGEVEISSASHVRIIAGGKVEIQADDSVDVNGNQRVKLRDMNGNILQVSSTGITNNASGRFEINSASMETNTGILRVDAGMARFSGVVQCETIIATSVVGSSYTPGAGNLS
jgi:hypothetical protein